MSRLDQVLAYPWGDFVPEHPGRAPWWQPRLYPVQPAYTGNIVTVPLVRADRAELHDLDRPSHEQDWLEPTDWMPVGWAVAP